MTINLVTGGLLSGNALGILTGGYSVYSVVVTVYGPDIEIPIRRLRVSYALRSEVLAVCRGIFPLISVVRAADRRTVPLGFRIRLVVRSRQELPSLAWVVARAVSQMRLTGSLISQKDVIILDIDELPLAEDELEFTETELELTEVVDEILSG